MPATNGSGGQPLTESSRAVFLSYASQDAAPGKRIGEALRAVGIEVWFDQSELRGGEAWDRTIRQQIRDCALFVPVISANSQARSEGYFRLEWRLAAERTRLGADGRPFLVPVAIDGVKEGDAAVPQPFRDVQWTHVPAQATAQDFALRVRRLLNKERKIEAGRPPRAPTGHAVPLHPGSREPRALPIVWLALTLLAVIVAVGAYLAVTRHRDSTRPSAGAGMAQPCSSPAGADSGRPCP